MRLPLNVAQNSNQTIYIVGCGREHFPSSSSFPLQIDMSRPVCSRCNDLIDFVVDISVTPWKLMACRDGVAFGAALWSCTTWFSSKLFVYGTVRQSHNFSQKHAYLGRSLHFLSRGCPALYGIFAAIFGPFSPSFHLSFLHPSSLSSSSLWYLKSRPCHCRNVTRNSDIPTHT